MTSATDIVAETSAGTNRRSFMMQAVSSISLAGAVLTSTPSIAQTDMADRANAFWAERLAQLERLVQLAAEYEAASAKLPDWAKPGLDRINADGNFCGGESAWPLVEDLSPAQIGERIVRPSIWQAKEQFEFNVRVFGFSPESRARYRATMRASIRKIVDRLRARNQLYEELGLSRMDREMSSACDAMCAAEEEIDKLEVTATVLAAQVMVCLCNDCSRSSTATGNGYCGTMKMGLVALRGLLPNLPACLIRDHAALFVANPGLPLSEMPFSPI